MPEKYLKFLNKGAVYVSGRLNKHGYQPVVIMNVKKLVEIKIEVEELQELMLFFYGWVIDNMLISGKIENCFFIYDIKDVAVTDLPMNKLKVMADVLELAYKNRMHRVVIINMNWLLKGICNLVYYWFNEVVQ